MSKPFGIIQLQRPPGLVFELPAPPPINRNSAVARLGMSARSVQEWIPQAHLALREQKINPVRDAVHGPFAIDIIWGRRRGDIDARIKYLLDYLQRVELIDNDGLCEHMTVGWGYAPRGCRVRLKAWDWQ